MRRIILLSTVLLATPFGMESYAADCATTNCQTLGYTATSNKGNCLQCPFGNYWFCPQGGESSQCDSSYKYACNGNGEYPSGDSCDGLYKKCSCQSPKSWSIYENKCVCGSGYINSCTNSGEKPGAQQCDGLYLSCSCTDSSKTWIDDTYRCVNKGTSLLYITSSDLYCDNSMEGIVARVSGSKNRPAKCSACPNKNFTMGYTPIIEHLSSIQECQNFISSWIEQWYDTKYTCARQCFYPTEEL